MTKQNHKLDLVLLMIFIAFLLAASSIDSLRSPPVLTAMALVYYLSNIIYSQINQQLSAIRVIEVGAAATIGLYVLLFLI